RNLRLEVRLPALEECDRAVERARLEAVRVDPQRLLDRAPGILAPAIVEGQLGDQEVCRHRVRIEIENGVEGLPGGRRVFLRDDAGQTEARPDIVRLYAHGCLEGLERIGTVVLLEEQFTPSDV